MDVLILIWVAYHALRGLWRGMIRVLCDILALGGAIFSAIHISPPLTAMASHWIAVPYTPLLWGIGLLLAGIVFVLINSVGKFLDKLTSTVGLGVFNRFLGFLFGAVKGLGLVIPLVFILNMTAPEQLEKSVVLTYYSDLMTYLDLDMANSPLGRPLKDMPPQFPMHVTVPE
jgi:membrane protein required for colicin V production